MTSISGTTIQRLSDRWIVRSRDSILVRIESEPGQVLSFEFDSGLMLRIEGTWKATLGSPQTGQVVPDVREPEYLGAKILSLVLFATGSVRLVLSGGLIIVATAADHGRIMSRQAGQYEWIADAGMVTSWCA